MPKVVLYISCTLDGFIAREDGSVDFLDRFMEIGEDHGFNDLLKRISVIVMGNRTFQEYSGAEKFYEYYKGKELFVFTREISADHDKVTFVNEDVRTFLENLQTDKDIWLLGGGKIIEAFHNESLIDEYIISIVPSVIGQGIPLFRQSVVESDLELVKSQSFETGIVNLHYKKITP
ncbi:MAG: dihydrofolate reductase family protein [Candidatus Heimdallarchaeaceae archaeon]